LAKSGEHHAVHQWSINRPLIDTQEKFQQGYSHKKTGCLKDRLQYTDELGTI